MNAKKTFKPNKAVVVAPTDNDADDAKKKKGVKAYPANSGAKTGTQAARNLGLL